jgi:hypothetical protein
MLPAKLSKGHDSGSPFKILMAPELHRKYNLLNVDFNIFKDTASCLSKFSEESGCWGLAQDFDENMGNVTDFDGLHKFNEL